MKYKIGDIVNLNDVNSIKNEAYDNAWAQRQIKKLSGSWAYQKNQIKKRITFKIISL